MILTSDHLALLPINNVQTYKGLFLGATEPLLLQWGEVIAKGPGHRGIKSGNLWKSHVEIGDIVLYPKGAMRQGFSYLEIDGVQHENIAFVNERTVRAVRRGNDIVPLHRFMIGKKEEKPAEVFNNGIWLPMAVVKPEEGKEDHVRVEVVASGFGQTFDTGIIVPNIAQKGDTVLVSKWDAWEYKLYDDDTHSGWVIVDEDQVLAIEERVDE